MRLSEKRDLCTAAQLIASASIDARSGLRFLPLGRFVTNPRGILAWPGLPGGLPGMLEELRAQCDLILLDTPPVLVVSDVLQLGPLADQVVLMINWRETPRLAVLAAMRVLERARMPATGVVMSKVELRRYGRLSLGDGSYGGYRAYRQPVAAE
ncbi:MAG: hypothetical protein JO122_19700 [Acetobacteraceae bacterium]|nr:hypothetical protein [Acetobacteraceae bacterium]